MCYQARLQPGTGSQADYGLWQWGRFFFLGSPSWIQPGWGLSGLGHLVLCHPCWVLLPCFPSGPSQLHQGSEEGGGSQWHPRQLVAMN